MPLERACNQPQSTNVRRLSVFDLHTCDLDFRESIYAHSRGGKIALKNMRSLKALRAPRLSALFCIGLCLLSFPVAADPAPLGQRDDGPGSSVAQTLPSTAKPFLTPATSTSSGAIQATATATTSSHTPITHISPGIPTNGTGSSNATCHRTIDQWRDDLNGPFCEPNMYDEVWVGGMYSITWDPARFPADSNDTVFIKYVNGSGDGDFPRWNQTVPNERGYVEVSMNGEWLKGQTRNNLSIWIDSVEPNGSLTQVNGPVVALISRPTPSASPSSTPAPAPLAPHKSSNKLGMEVGIPIGLAFLFALLLGLCWGMRRSRRGRGYIANRARSFRGHGTAQLTGDEFRTARRRGESFKDEPVQDVELQPRPGHAREDSMGAFMDNPTSAGLGDGPRHETNAFRAELARQRAGDHLPKR